MAISTVGFDGTVSEAQWSRLMGAVGVVGYKHGVTTGLVATAGAGTRQVSVSAGIAVMPGLVVDSDVVETATFAANASSINRIDHLVLRADWVTNTATLAVVEGASASVPPALTQTEGVVWEMPLARVTVRPGVTTLLTADVVVCKPLPRNEVVYSAVLPQTTVAYNGSFATAAQVTVLDPGWPFTLEVTARGRFSGAATGQGTLRVVAGATELVRGLTLALNLGAQDLPVSVDSAVLAGGPVVVSVQVAPYGMSTGSSLVLGGGGTFSVRVVPA